MTQTLAGFLGTASLTERSLIGRAGVSADLEVGVFLGARTVTEALVSSLGLQTLGHYLLPVPARANLVLVLREQRPPQTLWLL